MSKPPQAPATDGGESDLQKIMNAIADTNRAFEEKFTQLKQDVKKGQEETVERLSKKTRREKSFEFSKKGNRFQHEFNDTVAETLEDAQIDIDTLKGSGAAGSASKPFQSLEESIKKGQDLIAERQKLIKLADRSEFGWGVVSEYQSDELAVDDDDEKRIEKAAEKKLARKKRKSDKSGYTAAKKRPTYQPNVPTTTPPVGFCPQAPAAGYRNRFYPGRPVMPPAQPIGPCHECGELGHLKRSCPRLFGQGSKYPLLNFAACSSVLCDSGEKCENAEACSDKQPYTSEVLCEGGGVEERCEIGNEVVTYGVSKACSDKQSRFWESEGRVCASVKGRLKERFHYWRDMLHATEPVLKTIKNGYILPFRVVPGPYVSPNQRSAIENAIFVGEAIDELLKSGCVRQWSGVPYVCSPLLVVISRSGKKRLVINLRYVNQFLQKEKFKYEDMRTAMMLFEVGDYMFTFDLKSGYHHVDIHEQSQMFLGFEWEGKHYVFTVLPFGLSTACYVFTKLLRPLVRYWRGQGIRIVVYLDDGIGLAANGDKAMECSSVVQHTLREAGFVIQTEKSKFQPAQAGKWLGFDIDLKNGVIAIPEEKIADLHEHLKHAQQAISLSARAIASIVGKIIAMGLGIGPISRFRTRALYALLDTRVTWSSILPLDQASKSEIDFWVHNLTHYNGKLLCCKPSALRVVFSDASDTGYGGYMVEHGPYVAHGQWSEAEAGQSSTWRELRAVGQVLESIAGKLSNMRVRWFTDNQNVTRILLVGSRKEHLQKEALDIFRLTIAHNIALEPEWVPRDENKVADYLSRIIDYDDWSLNTVCFTHIDSIWGPHTVDRFANNLNTQLDRFNSRFWNPGSEAVDAFTINWGSENNWLCPPIVLIPRVIAHARACRCRGTLVVPAWPSAPFWPMLCPDGTSFANYVVGVFYLPLVEDLIIPGRSGSALFGGKSPSTEVLALRLAFD